MQKILLKNPTVLSRNGFIVLTAVFGNSITRVFVSSINVRHTLNGLKPHFVI